MAAKWSGTWYQELKYYLQFDPKSSIQNYSYSYLNNELQNIYQLSQPATYSHISSLDSDKSHKRRCLWCNVYRRRKWTQWHKFKSWTRLIAFHIALIPLGKVWIQLFSFQLWVNSRTDCVLLPWWGN